MLNSKLFNMSFLEQHTLYPKLKKDFSTVIYQSKESLLKQPKELIAVAGKGAIPVTLKTRSPTKYLPMRSATQVSDKSCVFCMIN
jgi:hypothetical protein